MVKKDYPHVKGEPYLAEIRELAVAEILRGVPRRTVALRYNIENATIISHWLRTFKALELKKQPKTFSMGRKKRILTTRESEYEFRIRELESALNKKDKALSAKSKELERSELKNELLNTMITIAEDKFGIEVRKKFGPKR